MKKLILLVVMTAMAFAGCQKSELVGPTGSSEVFTASLEGFGFQTKTSLTPENYVVWSADDRLAIFQGSAIADEYQLADGCDGLNGGSFKWVAKDNVVNDDFTAGTELPCNVAYYPYSQGLILKGDMQDDGKKIFTLANVIFPEIQYYAENSFGNGAFPMVAVTANVADHNLKFKNIGGAMKLQLKGSMAVKSIKIAGANGERLSGAASVTAYANNLTPAITMTGTDEASKSVTLDCGDGAQLNTTEATDFFIALPPVLFANGFTVTVTDAEEKEYTVTATDANTLLRSSILVMPEVLFEDSGEGASRDYVDEYGINHGQGIKIGSTVWAPVNCGYHATDYQWGKLYQWGRKYGQGYDSNDATTPEFSEGGVSLQGGQSSNNENVFFTSTSEYNYDWLYPQDDYLWNSGTESEPVKTENDPCPQGWRVPTYAELEELSKNHSEWTINENSQPGYWFSGSSSYSSEVAQVFFPAAGGRGLNGDADSRGDYGSYYSSRPADYNVDVLLFGNDVTVMGSFFRADGCSVRCVQITD